MRCPDVTSNVAGRRCGCSAPWAPIVPATPVATARRALGHVNAIEEELGREAERDAISRLAAAVGAADHGVAGLPSCLAALSDDRVRELVVSLHLSAPGARCGTCGRLAEAAPPCPTCGRAMQELTDGGGAAGAR